MSLLICQEFKILLEVPLLFTPSRIHLSRYYYLLRGGYLRDPLSISQRFMYVGFAYKFYPLWGRAMSFKFMRRIIISYVVRRTPYLLYLARRIPVHPCRLVRFSFTLKVLIPSFSKALVVPPFAPLTLSFSRDLTSFHLLLAGGSHSICLAAVSISP